MNLPSLATDNITELLTKIIEFTHARQKILTQNMNNVHSQGFIPKDLNVDEFSEVLKDAVSEHIRNQRLLLRDTENIKFGEEGRVEIRAIPDKYAKEMLENNPDEYIELQINKLLENSLNQRVAAELLRQKQGTASVFD
jgi:flagellar basal body rod protein FlgB